MKISDLKRKKTKRPAQAITGKRKMRNRLDSIDKPDIIRRHPDGFNSAKD